MKSTLALLFALQRAILYPEQKIVIVAPTKPQSARFVKKVLEFSRRSPNLQNEIARNGIKVGKDESSIEFANGSIIFTCPYSENALGKRKLI